MILILGIVLLLSVYNYIALNDIKKDVADLARDTDTTKKAIVSAERLAEETKRDASLLKLAAIIQRDFSSKTRDPFESAINIRNGLYQQIPLKTPPENFDFWDMHGAYLKSVNDDDIGQICGGLTILYLSALESQGIPARYVGIYSSDKHPYDSHSTVEFWYKGKWIASDPTFNVMFKRNGQFMSYQELYESIQNRQSYEVVTNGFPSIKNRTLDSYYIRLEDLMKYMVIHPSEVKVNGKILKETMKILPASWDGKITNEKGERRDVTNFEGIYTRLASGLLR